MRGGCRWPGSGQAEAQLATAKPHHHPRPSAYQNRPFPYSMLYRMEEGWKLHVARVYFKCFRCFIDILKKVDRDVAHVRMAIHLCSKCMF
jgi:hypothetical protein